MNQNAYSVLQVGEFLPAAGWAASPLGPFEASRAESFADARLHDALLIGVADTAALLALAERAELPQAAFDTAVVVWVHGSHGENDALAGVALLRMGVQAVLAAAGGHDLAVALRHAIERKRLEQAARHAYATDLATGLPHQAQLLEHMNHLLALREREPAPMVLLVLRIEGFAVAAARLGAEAANVLRRKVAVRLRSGLRASDVVSSIAPDTFAVLLGHVEALAHGERVASKLARAMQQPFQVAGQTCNVVVSVGMALYPDHGKDAETLLRRASAQAMSIASVGRDGFAGPAERGPARAANDDAAT